MIGYGSAEYQEQLHTSTKSKIGRCLGKFIQFPSLRDVYGNTVIHTLVEDTVKLINFTYIL